MFCVFCIFCTLLFCMCTKHAHTSTQSAHMFVHSFFSCMLTRRVAFSLLYLDQRDPCSSQAMGLTGIVRTGKTTKEKKQLVARKDQRRQSVKLLERRHQTLHRRLTSRDCRIQDGLIYEMITLNLLRLRKKLHSITLPRVSQ
jgi:hypothetical protein